MDICLIALSIYLEQDFDRFKTDVEEILKGSRRWGSVRSLFHLWPISKNLVPLQTQTQWPLSHS